MGTPEEVQALLRSIGLNRQEVHTRLDFLHWSTQDGERLQRRAAEVDGLHVDFIEQLYAHLGSFATPATLLQKPGVLSRLKASQRAYYQRLWNGPYDADYVRERLRVGWVHEHVGLDLKWYLGAYRLYLDHTLQSLLGGHPSCELFGSLLKAVFFDMSLAVDAYSATQRQALEHSDARYARALRGANDGIWDWDIGRDQLYLSERWAGMLGLSRDELGEGSAGWFRRVHPEDVPGLRLAIENHLSGNTPSLQYQYRIRHREGHYLWVLLRGVLSHDERNGQRLAGSQTDISQHKIAEQRLQHAARHDPLTGLGNRMRLQELLQQARERRQRPGAREAALLFIDLDRFKLINDSLGHNSGDQVLVEVAQRLSRCLRPGDHLLRFGGDEFVALLDDLAHLVDAEQVAQRMLDELHLPLLLGERQLSISASIGIAGLAEDDIGGDVLRAADLAMYRAKDAGKARFARYSAQLQARAERRLQLESALARALEQGEFDLHYQPVCRIAAGANQVIGVEALLRWQYAGQWISPEEFIPILEESGEILRVGEWVLFHAAWQCQRWQSAQPGLRCAVNLSSQQLQEAGFAGRVRRILAETGLPASCLVLEITESQLMQDSAQTLACLRELDNLGVRLALDDFGTGYSSLGYLKRFPLHILKVDKSFIAGSGDDDDLATIGRAIIRLGQGLNLDVIAEGVEQPCQLAFLRREGCQLAQGYLFSKPRPAWELDRIFCSQPVVLHHEDAMTLNDYDI